MHDLLVLVLVTLATYRLTVLIVRDQFPPVRWARVRLAGDEEAGLPRASWSPEWLADLVTCCWCASVWVAGGVVGAVEVFTAVGVMLPLLTWPAAAGVAAYAIERQDRHYQRPYGVVIMTLTSFASGVVRSGTR